MAGGLAFKANTANEPPANLFMKIALAILSVFAVVVICAIGIFACLIRCHSLDNLCLKWLDKVDQSHA